MLPLSRRYDTILFDLDGTLVDSAPDLWAALNHVLQHHGYPLTTLTDVHAFVGRGARYLLARGFYGLRAEPPANDPWFEQAVAQFMAYYRAHISDHSQPFSGVRDTLLALQHAGWQLAVVSNKREDLSRLLLEQLDLLHYFLLVIGGDSVAQCKPHPLPLQHAMTLLHTLPERTLMVGDSSNDTCAAQAAGCHAIVVTHGYRGDTPIEALQADMVIGDFAALAAFCHNLS